MGGQKERRETAVEPPFPTGGTFPRGGARKLVIPEYISDTKSRK
jgi:hypothetical protein